MNGRRRAQGAATGIVWAVIVLAGVGISGWAALAYLRPGVVVTEAVEAPVVQAFYSTGTVQPEHEHPLKSNTAGVLVEVRVDKGDRVKKGDVVAVVSDPGLVFKLRQAEAELRERERMADEKTSPALGELARREAAFEDMLTIAQREVDRTRKAIEQNATSQSELDRALNRLKQVWGDLEATKEMLGAKRIELQKDVEVARAAVDMAKWNVDEQTLRAPIDGAVLDRPATVGTRLAVNDHVMQVADVTPAKLVMRAAVDEEDVGGVRIGQTVRMTLYSFPGESFEGTVERIYDRADPERRTFEVDVRLTKPESRLAAGMTGELAFIVATKDRAVVLPSQAVQAGAVWTVADGQVHRRDAEVGIRSVERTEIVGGVAVGERVVISPAGSLHDGQAVRTTYMPPAEAAGLNKPAVKTDSFKGFQ